MKPSTENHGWALPQIAVIDSVFSGRWAWWLSCLYNNRLHGDIPQVDFSAARERSPYAAMLADDPKMIELIATKAETKKQMLRVLSLDQSRGRLWIDDVLDYWLWSLGSRLVTQKPNVGKHEDTLQFAFDSVIPRMMAHPCDWAAELLQELKYERGGPSGWFPTPIEIAKLMVNMTMIGCDKRSTVHEPCAGTGVTLLLASNYSVRLYAQDVSIEMVKWCTFQSYLYVPWLVRSGDHLPECREFDAARPSDAPCVRLPGLFV